MQIHQDNKTNGQMDKIPRLFREFKIGGCTHPSSEQKDIPSKAEHENKQEPFLEKELREDEKREERRAGEEDENADNTENQEKT